jgi:hypothetical protein
MALSVIIISQKEIKPGLHDNTYGLYSSEDNSYITTGSEAKCYIQKDILEREEQQADNREHFRSIRYKEIAALMTTGLSETDANIQLRADKPYLYQ